MVVFFKGRFENQNQNLRATKDLQCFILSIMDMSTICLTLYFNLSFGVFLYASMWCISYPFVLILMKSEKWEMVGFVY